MVLEKIFYPESIAVIGASREREKVGNVIFRNLLKSKIGRVYPVNPKAEKIEGVKCYKSILDVPDKVDLAIICVPAKIVPKVLDECGKKGVKGVVIISAGFSEVGNKKLEEELVNIARKYGIRIIGPNCLGIINMKLNMNATFYEGTILEGKCSIVSQSGALAVAILDRLEEEKIGISKLVSVGNMADVSWDEYIEYLDRDKDTKAIFLYMEGIKNGRKLIEILRKTEKPIYIIKAGRTSAGLKASATHTGSLAGDYKMFKDLVEVCGKKVKVIEDLEDMFLLLKLYNNYEKLGKKVVIVTNAGGPGVLASDWLEESGFKIVELTKEVMEELNKVLPEHWSHNNPIDIIGDAPPERYKNTLEILGKYDFYDWILVILTPQAMTQPNKVAKYLIELKEKEIIKKPIITMFLGGKSIKTAIEELESKGIINIREFKQLRLLSYFS